MPEIHYVSQRSDGSWAAWLVQKPDPVVAQVRVLLPRTNCASKRVEASLMRRGLEDGLACLTSQPRFHQEWLRQHAEGMVVDSDPATPRRSYCIQATQRVLDYLTAGENGKPAGGTRSARAMVLLKLSEIGYLFDHISC